MSIRLSDYLVFVDESGDHSLQPHDIDYPVFVLAFFIIKRSEYDRAEELFRQFKLAHLGRTDVVLHEHKIRKHLHEFALLIAREKRESFFNDLNQLMEQLNYTIIATAIRKQRFAAQYAKCENPYHLALEFCMERLKYFLKRRNEFFKTPILFESRGLKEDTELKKVSGLCS